MPYSVFTGFGVGVGLFILFVFVDGLVLRCRCYACGFC